MTRRVGPLTIQGWTVIGLLAAGALSIFGLNSCRRQDTITTPPSIAAPAPNLEDTVISISGDRLEENDYLQEMRGAGINVDDIIASLTPYVGITVAIDEGHTFLDDPGAMGTYNGLEVHEADIVKEIGSRLEALLSAAGVDVIMTNPSYHLDADPNFRNSERLRYAGDAELLISLHADVLPENVSRISTFYPDGRVSPLHSSLSTALTNRMNRVVGGDHYQHDVRREYFYRDGNGEIELGQDGKPMGPRILDGPMDSALLELGNMKNDQDIALLMEHPEQYAAAVAEGIVRYFTQVER